MGGSSSKPTEVKNELYGTFQLRQTQKFKINVLSDLITMIIGKNNLFDLSQLLSTPQGCQSLIILLQNKLNNEFTTLKLPDTEEGLSTYTTTSFLPITDYLKYQEKPVRMRLCKEFAFFVIRFTTLLSAMVASVAVQRNIAAAIIDQDRQIGGADDISTLREIPASAVGENKMTANILQDLLQYGTIQQVPNTNQPLYFFNNNESIILDANKSVVYLAKSNPSPVLGISITPYDPTLANQGVLEKLGAPGAQAFDAQAFGAQPFGTHAFGAQPFGAQPLSAQAALEQAARQVALEQATRQVVADQVARHVVADQTARQGIEPKTIVDPADQALATRKEAALHAVEAARQAARQGVEEPRSRAQGTILPPVVPNFKSSKMSNAGSAFTGRRTAELIARRQNDVHSVRSDLAEPAHSPPLRSRLSRRRKQRRGQQTRSRKQRAGAERRFFIVKIFKVLSCPIGGQCLVTSFIMDDAGRLWRNEAEFVMRGRNPYQQPILFVNFIQPILNSQSDRTPTIPVQASQWANQLDVFTTFNKMDKKTYEEFKYIQQAILGMNPDQQTPTSPAIYRALLLATGISKDGNGKQSLDTMFCKDQWVGRMTTTVPYSLLNILYYNLDSGIAVPERKPIMDAKATAQMKEAVSNFLTNDIAKEIPPAVTPGQELKTKPSAPTFAELVFISPKSIAKEFCEISQGRTGRTQVDDQRFILTNAHKALHELYNAHLEESLAFIRRIITLKDMGFREPYMIRLNPLFVSNPRGALVQLEDFMSEGRTMLSKHYFNVERIYKNAITGLQRISQGIRAAPERGLENVKNGTYDVEKKTDPLNIHIIGQSKK